MYVCVCRLAGRSANRHTQTHVLTPRAELRATVHFVRPSSAREEELKEKGLLELAFLTLPGAGEHPYHGDVRPSSAREEELKERGSP